MQPVRSKRMWFKKKENRILRNGRMKSNNDFKCKD